MMTSPVTFNPAAAYGMQPARLVARTVSRPVLFGSEAAQPDTPKSGCSTLSCTAACGGALALLALPVVLLASRFMTPSELKSKNIVSVTAAKDTNDAVLPKTFVVKSKVGETVSEGVLKKDEKSGLFGFFKKATLTFDGTPATTQSVRMMFLPSYLKKLLNNGPDELGSPRKWDTAADALKLGDIDVPKGAKLATNVYGEQLAVFKQGRHYMVGGVNLNGELTAAFKRDDDYVVVGPTEIGKKDSLIIKKTYTPDKAPAAVKAALKRYHFGSLF